METSSVLDFTSNRDFAEKFESLMIEVEKNPLENFIRSPLFMNFDPTPAQTVALKTVFGQKLDSRKKHKIWMEIKREDDSFDLEVQLLTEVELYKYMTEQDYNPLSLKKKNKINFIIGRRGGKTTLAAMLAIYCAIKENWRPYLNKTRYATVLILSHSREFSDEVLDIIRGLIEDSPVLKRVINKRRKNTASTMNLAVPYFKEKLIEFSRVQIKVGAASSKTTRGIAACAVLCDEIAFWNLDENMKESDAKILKAVRPATKQFGRKALLIKLSSPGIKQGILYSEWNRWLEGKLPSSYTCFKAPTWVWNTILPKEEYVEEWELDEDGFNTEYRANFVDSLSNFILPEFIDLATMKGVSFCPPEPRGKASSVTYKAAIDAAYKKDVFTFSVMGHFENRIKQYVLKGFAGTKENPVRAFEVAKYVRTICNEYGIDEVEADQYSFQPLKEIFEQFGITLTERVFSLTFKKKVYFNLKRLVHSQQIDLLDNPTLIGELKALVVEQTPSGQIRIGHPPGGSDDYSDATAVATYSAVETAGQLGFSFSGTGPKRDYGIKTDVDGKSFSAPSPEMVAEKMGLTFIDNSAEFIKDPETGKLVKIEALDEDEGDDDGPVALF